MCVLFECKSKSFYDIKNGLFLDFDDMGLLDLLQGTNCNFLEFFVWLNFAV